MGISGFLCGLIVGAAGVEFIRECVGWHKTLQPQRYPTNVNTLGAEPTSMHALLAIPDLLEATIEPQAELTRIEREICNRVGAKPDTDAADVVMHAVRDGHDWNAVLDLERAHLFGPVPKNRIARWV